MTVAGPESSIAVAGAPVVACDDVWCRVCQAGNFAED
jgi:hypothetical protein